jgi:hypothetical protein
MQKHRLDQRQRPPRTVRTWLTTLLTRSEKAVEEQVPAPLLPLPLTDNPTPRHPYSAVRVIAERMSRSEATEAPVLSLPEGVRALRPHSRPELGVVLDPPGGDERPGRLR